LLNELINVNHKLVNFLEEDNLITCIESHSFSV